VQLTGTLTRQDRGTCDPVRQTDGWIDRRTDRLVGGIDGIDGLGRIVCVSIHLRKHHALLHFCSRLSRCFNNPASWLSAVCFRRPPMLLHVRDKYRDRQIRQRFLSVYLPLSGSRTCCFTCVTSTGSRQMSHPIRMCRRPTRLRSTSSSLCSRMGGSG
jgi:hypothetical protein